jgi:outer membrane protein TolC
MSQPAPTPTLRYSRLGGGYRREDVEAALAQLLSTVRAVEESLEQLRSRSAELEAELLSAEAELAAYREREQRFDEIVARAEELLGRAEASTAAGDGAA